MKNYFFVIFIISIFPFYQSVNAKASIWDDNPTVTTTAKKLVNAIKTNKTLGSFINNKVNVVYSEYNRCYGTTNGNTTIHTGNEIDKIVNINVYSSGEGWACKEQKSRKYSLKFDIHQIIKESFKTIEAYYNPDKLILDIYGNYPSVWFTFSFIKENEHYVINKIEFNHEDPG